MGSWEKAGKLTRQRMGEGWFVLAYRGLPLWGLVDGRIRNESLLGSPASMIDEKRRVRS